MKFKRIPIANNDSAGTFLKIDDNSSVNGIVRGEVLEFYQDWPKGGEKLAFDKPTPGAKPRFKVNFIVFEEGRFIAKIWDYPPTVSNMLADAAEAYDLSKTKIKISKHKRGEQVSYTILPLAGEKDKLTPKQLKDIEAVELNVLSIKEQSSAPPASNEGGVF